MRMTSTFVASIGLAVSMLVSQAQHETDVKQEVQTVHQTETLTQSIYRVKGNSFMPIDRALQGYPIDLPNDGNAYDEGDTYRVGVDGNGDITTIEQTESDNY